MLNNCSTSCNFLPFHQDEPMAGDYLFYNRKTALNVKTWNADTKHYREPTKACEGGMMVSSNRSILCIVVAINRITYRCSLKMKTEHEASSPNITTQIIIPANLPNWYYFYKTIETS